MMASSSLPQPHPLSTISKTDVSHMPALSAVDASKVIASYNIVDKGLTPILKDSASNVHLIPENFVDFVGLPTLREDDAGTLKGIGEQATLGTCPLLFGLQTIQSNTYVYHDPQALIIRANSGPKTPLLSEVLAEKKGCSWRSNHSTCILTTPCGQDIYLKRDHITGFWFLQALISGPEVEHARQQQLQLPPSTFHSSTHHEPCIYTLQPHTRPHAQLRIPKPRFPSLPHTVELMVKRTHENLGHVSRSRLIDLANSDAVIGLEHLKGLPRDASSFCDSCIRGKTKAQPAPKHTIKRLEHKPWGTMTLDLTGHIEVKSLERHHYGLIAVHAGSLDAQNNIIDDGGTGFSIYRGLNLRSDVLTSIQNIINVIGTPPKRLHTDNAKELCSKTAESFYLRHGINHTTIPPYQHYSLGKAERLWGTLKSLAKCMLIASGVPPHCWELALKHANLIKNMLMPPPNKAAPTQWEAYYGVKPDLTTVWAFGCLAYIYITPEQKSALKVPPFGPTAISGLYMGISTLNGENKHLVLSDNNTLLACTFANIYVNPDIYPCRPAATIASSIAHTALLTYRDSPKLLIDPHEDLTPLSYLQYFVTTKRSQPTPSKPSLSYPTLADQISQKVDKATKRTSSRRKGKETLPKDWYEATIIGHQGDGDSLRYLIRWDGYSAEHDNWVHPKDISTPAIKEYHDKLNHTPTLPNPPSTSPLTTRLLPKDVVNGDYTHLDPFKEIPDRRHEKPVTDPTDITILPQSPDFYESLPYNNATYSQLVPTDNTTPEVKTSSARSYLGRHTRRALDPYSDASTATITDFDPVTQTFTLTHSDNDTEYIDADTLHHFLIRHDSTLDEDRQRLMSTCYNAAAKQAATLFDDEPKGEKQVLQHPESEAILASKAKEINSFYDMQVMKTVPMSTLPPGATILPSHLIYKRKYKIDEKTKQNVFDKWKTRLVIGGNRQKEHDNAFAPTPSWSSIRMALAYTASKDWKVVSYDLASAFCRTPLQGRAIYVRPPPGLVPPGHCWQLLHSIYGLIEACADYSALRNQIILTFEYQYQGHTLRFSQSEADPCMFIMSTPDSTPILILVAYIDDLILCYKIEYIKDAFVNWLDRTWEVSDPEPLNRYLGIHFTRLDDGSWTFNAKAYIQKACEKYTRYPILPHATPLPAGYIIDPAEIEKHEPTAEQRKHFQSLIGTLLYGCTTVRWDISYALSALSQYLVRPTEDLIKMAYRVLGYLLKTEDFGITYRLPKRPAEQHILHGSCDAGFAGCLQTRRSQEGYIIFYNGGPISWSSKRQAFVSLSTCEAELASLVHAAKQMVFLNKILTELSRPQQRMVIYEDNSAAIKISNQETPSNRSRTKHIDIKFHWLAEQIQAGLLVPHHIPTNYNIADIMTKALSPEVFKRLLQYASELRSNPALASPSNPHDEHS